jgi:GAF domain-containing protein
VTGPDGPAQGPGTDLPPGAALLVRVAALAGDTGPVLSPSGYDDLVEAVTATAMRMFGAKACSLALLSEDDSELVFTTVVGLGADAVKGLRVPSGHGIAGWVAMSGQPLVVSDLRSDPRWSGPVDTGTDYAPTSILAAPIATSERLLGVLEVLDRSEDRPEAAADMELLNLVADQAALALEGARAFDDFGRRLLRALAASAAQADEDLVVALDAAAAQLPPPDGDLLELAALFGELGRLDVDERRLAVRVVRQFVSAAGDRQARTQAGRLGPRGRRGP